MQATDLATSPAGHAAIGQTPLPTQRHIRCLLGVAGANAVLIAPCDGSGSARGRWLLSVDGPLAEVPGPSLRPLGALKSLHAAAAAVLWRRDEAETLVGQWPVLRALGIDAIAIIGQRSGPRGRLHHLVIGWDGRRSREAVAAVEQPARDLLHVLGPDLPCCRRGTTTATGAAAVAGSPRHVPQHSATDRNLELVEYVAPELRAPLQALTNSLTIPSATGFDRIQAERITRARAAVEHIDDLLEDLERRTVEMAGRDEPSRPATAVPLRLELLTAEVAALVADELRAAGGLALRLELEHTATAYGDPLKTRQMLLNLLRNAVQHASEAATHIELTTADDGDAEDVIIAVNDDGAGVPDDALGRLFEPGSRSHRPSMPGRGMGLAITRRLAEEMGGSLTVRHSVTRGLRLELRLPLSPRNGQGAASSNDPSEREP